MLRVRATILGRKKLMKRDSSPHLRFKLQALFFLLILSLCQTAVNDLNTTLANPFR